MLEPRKLRSELEMRGLQVLSLHGNAGQWRDGAAQMLIASVPGVSRVIESAQSSSILLVTMARGV
jgi:hypothetical protein